MVFYMEKEQLYLETEIGPGSNILQVKERMWLPWNEAPDNAALYPIMLISKSLTCVGTTLAT